MRQVGSEYQSVSELKRADRRPRPKGYPESLSDGLQLCRAIPGQEERPCCSLQNWNTRYHD